METLRAHVTSNVSIYVVWTSSVYLYEYVSVFYCVLEFGCEANAVLERRAVPWQDIKARQPGTAALATAATAAYVCGPASMTDDMLGTLKRMGVPHVYSEQWW